MRNRFFICLVLAALAGGRAAAHDFWLAADPWRPGPGARVAVTANLGDHFPTGTSYTQPDRIDQWRVLGPTGDVTVTREFRRQGETLVADAALPAPGAYLGVMTVKARTTEMKGPSFTKYLQEEGLDQIVAVRQSAGEADQAARERYARYAKVAIRNGNGDAAHLMRPVGLPAEFVPASDPTSVHPGGSLTLQLLAGGKPVSGAAVAALGSGEGAAVKGRTDENGRVTLTFDREGAWLIRTVHMVKVPQTGSADADWESYWVTLAFHTAAH